MPFKYSCFISYCHGKEDLVKTFIEELKTALKQNLDPYLDEEVFIDEDRLRGGDLYNEGLATAICQSVCMIVVYTPKYERHSYCLREYAAMEELERKRLQIGETKGLHRGLIIPVVFRGPEYLPPTIKGRRQYYDFSRFTLANPKISDNPEYINQIGEIQIGEIAQTIYQFYQTFEEQELSGHEVCGDCSTFTLPLQEQLQPWREKARPPVQPLPGRVGNG